jgi:hypothetical protein
MAGIFSNPLNWQITDSFQGQSGGINPAKAFIKYTSPLGYAGDVVKDRIDTPSWTVDTNNAPTGNAGVTDPTNTGGGSTTTTGGSGGGAFDWSSVTDAQNLVTQANDVLGRLGNQRNTFNQNLTYTYQQYRDRLGQDFNRNKGEYDTSKVQTLQDQERVKQQIRVQAGQQANALQRFLGARGAGDSMAARQLAPYGVARQGQQMQNEANQTYGRNLSGLEGSWNQYNTDYQNNLGDLASQQENARKKGEQDFLQQEYSARDNLSKGNQALNYAQSGNAAAAKALREQALPQLYQILQQIDALGKQDVAPTVTDASYAAPELSQYTVEGAQPVQGVDQSAQSDVNPYLQWLLKQKEQDLQTFGY